MDFNTAFSACCVASECKRICEADQRQCGDIGMHPAIGNSAGVAAEDACVRFRSGNVTKMSAIPHPCIVPTLIDVLLQCLHKSGLVLQHECTLLVA